MRMNDCVDCRSFPCQDVQHASYVVPGIEVDPAAVSMVMISEAAPADLASYYYAGGDALFEQTTVQAFNDAGSDVTSIQDILALGVYLTTAVKCGKTGYGIKAATIRECSLLLEKELVHFADAKVYMLMGDVAIKAINYISKRAGGERVIPAGSTYKIRGQVYSYGAIRAFPSYLQAGPSFFIEKSKRRMIAEDIREALRLIQV